MLRCADRPPWQCGTCLALRSCRTRRRACVRACKARTLQKLSKSSPGKPMNQWLTAKLSNRSLFDSRESSFSRLSSQTIRGCDFSVSQRATGCHPHGRCLLQTNARPSRRGMARPPRSTRSVASFPPVCSVLVTARRWR